jgi:hypothetical protein
LEVLISSRRVVGKSHGSVSDAPEYIISAEQKSHIGGSRNCKFAHSVSYCLQKRGEGKAVTVISRTASLVYRFDRFY